MRAGLLLLLLPWVAAVAEVPTVVMRELSVDFSPATLVAASGEQLQLGMDAGLVVELDGAPHGEATGGGWSLQAPAEPGLYALQVTGTEGRRMDINLFVTVPASSMKNGGLNGYRIGPPPPGHRRYPELYRPPPGFIEVTADMLDVQLSPHFRLRQLLCKQESGYPKYLVLKESLLVLLEGLLAAVRTAGEKGLQITRFKGLGEMNAEELRQTTLDPDNRTLLQVTMEDAGAADDIFRILMGDKVEPRREFIEKHALEVRNLDV